MNDELKTTVFLTSHDSSDIEILCERAIVINHGEILFDNDIETLRSQFLGKKVITAKVSKPITNTLVEDLEHHKALLIEKNKFSVTLELDNSDFSAENVVAIISGHGSLIDMAVKGSEIEDVIHSIYTDGADDVT